MIITEIVRMKTIEGVTKDAFIEVVDGLERDFHSRQKGFIDTELLYHEEDNEWFMVQHWNSRDDLKEAAKKIFVDQSAEQFMKSLNKHSVKMTLLTQIAAWKTT